MDDLIRAIQSVLSDDLLKKNYLKIVNRHLTTGHCYAASEAAFHLLGGGRDWMAVCGRDESGTHWWLKHKHTHMVLDITAEQFTVFGKKPPYQNSKPCGFLTKTPSKRAQIILDRLKEKYDYVAIQ